MRLTRSLGPLIAITLLIVAATPSAAATGDLDPAFGGDGASVARFQRMGHGRAAALDPDGRLVVAGSGGHRRFALARFLPNGALDPTFGGDGKVKLGRGGLADIDILPDGRIIGVGGNVDGWFVCRITEGGELDQSFGTGGFAQLAYAAGSARGVAIDPSGRILVAGSSSLQASLARYRPGGTLDPSFDGDGRRIVRIGSPDPGFTHDELTDIAPIGDGGLVATGLVDSDSLGIVRLDEDGSLTKTFGDGGSVVASISRFDRARAVIVQGDRILIGALLDYAMTVVAYDLDGSPDTGFGGGDGMTTIDPGSAFDVELTTDPEGRTVVAGTVDNRLGDIVVARLDESGDPDGSFGDGGVATVPLHFDESAGGVAVRPEGAIVVGGTRYGAHGYMMITVQLQA